MEVEACGCALLRVEVLEDDDVDCGDEELTPLPLLWPLVFLELCWSKQQLVKKQF